MNDYLYKQTESKNIFIFCVHMHVLCYFEFKYRDIFWFSCVLLVSKGWFGLISINIFVFLYPSFLSRSTHFFSITHFSIEVWDLWSIIFHLFSHIFSHWSQSKRCRWTPIVYLYSCENLNPSSSCYEELVYFNRSNFNYYNVSFYLTYWVHTKSNLFRNICKQPSVILISLCQSPYIV